MDFRYLDADGKEQTLTTTVALVEAIRRGDVTANTLVHEPKENRWIKAEVQEDFEAIVSAPKPAGDVETGKQFKKDRRSGWLLFAAGFVGIIVIGALVGLSSFRIGYALGQAVFLGILCAAAIQLPLRRNAPVESSGRVYLIAGIAFVAVCTVLLALQVREHSQEMSALRALGARVEQTKQLYQGRMANPAQQSVSPTPSDPSASLYGNDGAVVLRIMDAANARKEKIANDWATVAADIEAETLLEAKTLSTAAGRKDVRARLTRWSEGVERMATEQEQFLVDLDAEFQSAPLSPEVAASALHGLRESPLVALGEEFIQVEREIIASVEELLRFIETRRAVEVGDGGTMLFETDAEVERFNELYAKITELATREVDINRRQLETLEQSKAGLDQLTK